MLSGDFGKWARKTGFRLPHKVIKFHFFTQYGYVFIDLSHLNGTLCESRWIFPELLKSAPSAPLPTSSSGTPNIRDRGTRAPPMGFSQIAFTYFGVAMGTFIPAIVLPNIRNKCARE
jgi:hypothetical protein